MPLRRFNGGAENGQGGRGAGPRDVALMIEIAMVKF